MFEEKEREKKRGEGEFAKKISRKVGERGMKDARGRDAPRGPLGASTRCAHPRDIIYPCFLSVMFMHSGHSSALEEHLACASRRLLLCLLVCNSSKSDRDQFQFRVLWSLEKTWGIGLRRLTLPSMLSTTTTLESSSIARPLDSRRLI